MPYANRNSAKRLVAENAGVSTVPSYKEKLVAALDLVRFLDAEAKLVAGRARIGQTK